MWRVLLAFLVTVISSNQAFAFLSPNDHAQFIHQIATRRSSNKLCAGGGFGAPKSKGDTKKTKGKKGSKKTAAADSKLDEDFAVFPPLAGETLRSLRPIDYYGYPEGSKPVSEKDIPNEIKDLVTNVYGFPNFDIDGKKFPGLRLLHADPVVFAVDDFFTEEECDAYIQYSDPNKEGAKDKTEPEDGKPKPTLIKQSKTMDPTAKSERTSTTWFHHFSTVPELMVKACTLLGADVSQWEEPQTVRYRKGEKFTWHMDALPPEQPPTTTTSDVDDAAPVYGPGGGQRIATLLVYLNTLSADDGGSTLFRDLRQTTDGYLAMRKDSSSGSSSGSSGDRGGKEDRLHMRPKKGSALLFFPSAGGLPGAPFDIRTIHSGEVVKPTAKENKWIAQLWLRQGPHRPSLPGNEQEKAKGAMERYESEWTGAMST